MYQTRDARLTAAARKIEAITKQLDALIKADPCGCGDECPVCYGLSRLATDADELHSQLVHALNADCCEHAA